MKRKLIAAILCISLIAGGCSTALTESAAEEDDTSESSGAEDTIIVSYDEDADETEAENSASEDEPEAAEEESEESEDDDNHSAEEDEAEEETTYEIEDAGLITTIDMIDTEDQFTERDLDSSYSDRDPQYIALNNESTDTGEVSGAEVSFSDGIVITISEEGVYVFSGTLDDGQIVIDCEDDDAKVQVVLNDVSITNDSGPCILGLSADKIFVTLEGENTLSDTGDDYEQIEELDKTIDGVIFADCDLTINGSGTLEINALYANGVVSKEDLKICGGYTVIYSEGKGIEANDSIRIASGVVTIEAEDDGMHTDNDEDVGKGYIYIENGTIMISSGDDGIHSATAVLITGGSISITESYEGIEGDAIYIHGGTIDITSSDDGLNASTSESGTGGGFGAEFSLGNDAVMDWAEDMEMEFDGEVKPGTKEDHDDEVMPIENGNEAEDDIDLSKGDANDSAPEDMNQDNTKETNDGENFGDFSKEKQGENTSDTDETGNVPQDGKEPENETNLNENEGNSESGVIPDDDMDHGQNENRGGHSSMGMSFEEDSACIIISGGTIYINADGDGIDSNGDLTIEGGEVYINGPTGNQDTAIDYGESGEFLMNGGTVIAVGSSGMVETPSENSTQYSITSILDEDGESGDFLKLLDSDGNIIAEFTAEKSFDSVFISTGEITSGTYSLNINGTATEISVDSIVTKSGSNAFGSGSNSERKEQGMENRMP